MEQNTSILKISTDELAFSELRLCEVDRCLTSLCGLFPRQVTHPGRLNDEEISK